MLFHVNKTILSLLTVSDKTVTAVESADCSCKELDKDTVVFCKHIGGPAPDHVCVVYRAQQGETGRPMCAGCVIDAVLYRPQESARDGIRVYNA